MATGLTNAGANSYSTNTYAGYTVYGGSSTTVPSSIGTMSNKAVSLQWSASDDHPILKFKSMEAGKDVTLRFDPEHDLSARESMNIMLALAYFQNVAGDDTGAILRYIRARNLERHFQFSA